MPLIILEDGSMLEFDKDKYFENVSMPGSTIFTLRQEFECVNRPELIILNFIDKEYYEEYANGHPRWLKYAEVI